MLACLKVIIKILKSILNLIEQELDNLEVSSAQNLSASFNGKNLLSLQHITTKFEKKKSF